MLLPAEIIREMNVSIRWFLTGKNMLKIHWRKLELIHRQPLSQVRSSRYPFNARFSRVRLTVHQFFYRMKRIQRDRTKGVRNKFKVRLIRPWLIRLRCFFFSVFEGKIMIKWTVWHSKSSSWQILMKAVSIEQKTFANASKHDSPSYVAVQKKRQEKSLMINDNTKKG